MIVLIVKDSVKVTIDLESFKEFRFSKYNSEKWKNETVT